MYRSLIASLLFLIISFPTQGQPKDQKEIDLSTNCSKNVHKSPSDTSLNSRGSGVSEEDTDTSPTRPEIRCQCPPASGGGFRSFLRSAALRIYSVPRWMEQGVSMFVYRAEVLADFSLWFIGLSLDSRSRFIRLIEKFLKKEANKIIRIYFINQIIAEVGSIVVGHPVDIEDYARFCATMRKTERADEKAGEWAKIVFGSNK